MLKSGGRWVDAPEVYGPRKMLYNWAAKGVRADNRFEQKTLSASHAVFASQLAELLNHLV